MSDIVRWVLLAYSVIGAGTLLFQFYIRWGQCTGLGDCLLSSAKAVVWSLIWPVYWPFYLSVL